MRLNRRQILHPGAVSSRPRGRTSRAPITPIVPCAAGGPGDVIASQPGQGIGWDRRRWRCTSRACRSRTQVGRFHSYPMLVRVRPCVTSNSLGSISSRVSFPNSPAPSSATSTLHPNSNSRIASWPHGLLQPGARRSCLGRQA